MIDYIIVGGGYAGCLLTAALLEKNYTVRLFDSHFEKSPSAITSGLINPVTGRNIVKSWRFKEFRDVAIPFYDSLQKKVGFPVMEPKLLCRMLQNPREWNEYGSKKGTTEYADVLGEEIKLDPTKYFISDGFEIKEAYRIRIPEICSYCRKIFAEKKCLQLETFDYGAMKQNDGYWSYKDLNAKKVIFCEGVNATQNPYFSHIQFIPAAGEYLMVEIPNLNQPFILNQHKALVPYEKDCYWFGATFRWDLSKPIQTEAGKEELIRELESMIRLPFTIIDHGGAIRPTIKDRRPAIGPHQTLEGLYILNGLGTKAASMLPYYVQHLCDVLEGRTDIEPEVSHTRFLPSSL